MTPNESPDILRARLASVVEDSDDAILTKTLEGIITTWNRGAERIFGYTAEEAIGKSVTLLLPVERYEEETGILERLKRGERIDHFETIRRRKDGRLIHISLTVSPIRDAAGKVVGASKIARDITEMKRTRNELNEASLITDELNTVARALATELKLENVVQIITDAGTRVTRALFGAFFYNVLNAQGESYMLYTLSGVPREAFAKFPMPRATEIFAPTFKGEGVVRLADVRQDPRFGRNAPYHGMPKGHLPVVSYLAVPVIDRAGVVLGGLFFGHPDVGRFTARDETIVVGIAAQASAAMDNARLYQAEQAARAEAEKASRAKDHFLATLSHELRTPLTPVLAIVSDLATDPDLPVKWTEALATVRRNVELEARLIDDLLDLTRIAQGKLELHLEMTTVGAVVDSALGTCLAELEEKDLVLSCELANRDQTFAADSARLTQIVWNLLKNAIKFTPTGGAVTLRTRISNTTDRPNIIFEVADTGIGMDGSVIARLFRAFEQGGRDITRQYGGLGLGLAISDAIAKAHGGVIAAHSAGPGQGSTFTLSLPLVAGIEDSERHGTPLRATWDSRNPLSPGRAPRILFVEDHADTAKVLGALLQRDGYEILPAATAAAALATAEREMAGAGIDLVVSDVGLPDGSGLELMSSLSQRYGLRGIALTGFGMDSDRQAAHAAGFVHHITKPIDSRQLRAVMSAYFRAREPDSQ